MRFLEFLPTRSATPAGDDKFAVLPVEWDFELFSIPTGEDCSEWAELTDASTVMTASLLSGSSRSGCESIVQLGHVPLLMCLQYAGQQQV